MYFLLFLFSTIVCEFILLKTHVCNVVILCIFLFIIQHHVTYELKECNVIMQHIAIFCKVNIYIMNCLLSLVFCCLQYPCIGLKKSTLWIYTIGNSNPKMTRMGYITPTL
jgi:hypothetical protein